MDKMANDPPPGFAVTQFPSFYIIPAGLGSVGVYTKYDGRILDIRMMAAFVAEHAQTLEGRNMKLPEATKRPDGDYTNRETEKELDWQANVKSPNLVGDNFYSDDGSTEWHMKEGEGDSYE